MSALAGLGIMVSAGAADPFQEFQELTASDAAPGDSFGSAVAIQGDTAIVGAPAEDGAGTDRGALYVFGFDGSSWVETQRLIASDGQSFDAFGTSVALDGDRLVVGAPFANPGGSDRGAAYVFERNPGTGVWSQAQKLIASNGANSDRFGVSVAIGGDRVLVGANAANAGGTDRGAVYAFGRDAVTNLWAETQILLNSDSADFDEFGRTLGLSGDVAVIGAMFSQTGGAYRGSAYIFTHSGAPWTEAQRLQPADTGDNSTFGMAVAVNAAGDVVVCANSEGLGAGYLYERDGATWTPTHKFSTFDPESPANNAVVLSDSLCVMGGINSGGINSGVVAVFRLEEGVWGEAEIVEHVGAESGEDFGAAVGLAGDNLLIGAPDRASEQGNAYIFTPQPVVSPTAPPTLSTKKTVRTSAARVKIRGISTGIRVQAVTKVGKKKKTKTIPVLNGQWKFKVKLQSKRTKVTFTAFDSTGRASRPAKVKVIQKRRR